MPPKKETNLTRPQSAAAADAAVVEQLDDNVIAIIFSCLGPVGIMRMRRVCKKWRDAAKKAIVDHFCVDSIVNYNAMRAMTTALPNLQQLSICSLGKGHKYIDGEDPNERRAAQTANYTTHDINIISNFRKLRRLNIYGVPVNGRYPTLLNFPLLEKLKISLNYNFKWELEMLSGCPMLRELNVEHNISLRGNIGSLNVLRNSLEKVKIFDCYNVEGHFMDLADFPHLKLLNLRSTKVTGDIRDITENDFLHLECIVLPKTVIGGWAYQFQRISEVPSVMNAVYLCMRRNRDRELFSGWCWYLSRESPDWYDGYHDFNRPDHPFTVDFVQARSRLGWRWRNEDGDSCEINWLDPEPDRICDADTRSLQPIQEEIGFYKGYYHPPTAEEYNRLCDEYSED
mmetsp:Transcript_33945/g.50033  ORF Transcript_33945/g.50033 Transcript_33945/m.50033 type:complete len:399 (+) Transcript_33945:207-1403(+)|eukprot:scaffold41013_cov250-Skeletonema_dohrnii-CCMP3373.AAC.3